jgi:hypothetical protein
MNRENVMWRLVAHMYLSQPEALWRLKDSLSTSPDTGYISDTGHKALCPVSMSGILYSAASCVFAR